MSVIINLPIEIYHHIHTFVDHESFNNLLNISTKSNLKEIKREACYFKFSRQRSFDFVRIIQFRLKVLSRIKNPGQQLSLELGLPSSKLIRTIELNCLRELHSLTIIDEEFLDVFLMVNFKWFSSVANLSLSGSKGVIACNGLSKVQGVSLNSFENLSDLSHLATLTSNPRSHFKIVLKLLILIVFSM